LSYYSYDPGFFCENAVNHTMVLASGEIVNANAGINEDLWVVLKGGNSNLGVVTGFDLRIFELK
jgi:FAD/FMN-containing dehydrogenase